MDPDEAGTLKCQNFMLFENIGYTVVVLSRLFLIIFASGILSVNLRASSISTRYKFKWRFARIIPCFFVGNCLS